MFFIFFHLVKIFFDVHYLYLSPLNCLCIRPLNTVTVKKELIFLSFSLNSSLSLSPSLHLVLQARPSRPSHLHGDPGAPAPGRGQPQRHRDPRPSERPPAEERGRGGGLHEAPRAAGEPQRLQLHPLAHFRRAGACVCLCALVCLITESLRKALF